MSIAHVSDDLQRLGIDAYCHIVHTYGHNDDYGFEADRDVIVIRFKNNSDMNLWKLCSPYVTLDNIKPIVGMVEYEKYIESESDLL